MTNFLSLISLLCMPIFGQNSGVSGIVTTAGEPLELVQIVVKDLERGTLTGKDGMYSLEDIPGGTYRILAKTLGFVSQEKEILIKEGIPLTINFELLPDQNELGEVLIIDKRAGLNRKTPYNISTIEMQDLKNTGSPGGLMGVLLSLIHI